MSLLWKITFDHRREASYLFGTMHAPDSRVYEIAERVLPFIQEVSAFAAEFNLNDVSRGLDSSGFSLPEGTSLNDWISPGHYARLKKIYAKTIGINLDHFRFTLPLLTSHVITERMLHGDMGQALDEHLWSFAAQNGKEMFGIETLSEQMETLRKIPLEVQIKMLCDSGRSIGSMRKNMLHLIDLYQKGKIQQLYKSVKKNSRSLRKILLYRRNETMAERIAELTGRQSAFVAIGAGHLGGGKGLIRLLKKRNLKLASVPILSTDTSI